MVFFNCNACGEAVKKNQVEKHYQQQCRRCEVLSCVDCGKEFWGDEYQKHIKCITEDEKYGGKSFKPKLNANKGELKQELWVKQVQDAISKVKTNPKLKNLLEGLQEYPNIPRKQAKFENFLRNSIRILDKSLATQAWNAIAAELENKVTKEDATVTKETVTVEEKNDQEGTIAVTSENGKSETKKKEKKRKQEEDVTEDEKQTPQTEIQDESETNGNNNQKKKKNKKRKAEDEASLEENVENPKKKKSKRDTDEDKEETTVENVDDVVEEVATGKFKWEAAIFGVLKRADDKEMSVKKLRKKVLAEYYARGGDGKSYTEEKLLAKFTKKINKNPRLKILKETVKLIS